MSETAVCKKCTLHSKIPKVKIEENGNCSFCNTLATTGNIHVRLSKYYVQRMESLFEKVKSENHDYDAIVLFSGGKDSTYLLHMLKNKYKLKLLALSIIHPFVNEAARKNMERIAEKLNIDLIKYQVNTELYTRFIKYGLLKGEKYKLDEFAGCSCCEFFNNWIGLKMAIKMRIPILIDGLVKQQIINRFVDNSYIVNKVYSGLPLFNDVQAAFEAMENQTLKEWLQANKFEKDDIFINIVSPFTFTDYSEEDAFRAIEEIGLKKEDFYSTRTNCRAVPLFDYISFKKFDCPTYAKQYANAFRHEYHEIDNNMHLDNRSDEDLQKDRADMLSMLNEYKELLFYIAEGKIRGGQVDEKLIKRCTEFVDQSKGLLDQEEFMFHFDRALYINDLADFFDIDLLNLNS